MIVSLLLGLRGFGRDFDITAPPHDTTAQTLAPNDPLLRRLWLQTTSFTQDASGHTEMLWLHFSIVERSGDASSIFFYSLWAWPSNIWLLWINYFSESVTKIHETISHLFVSWRFESDSLSQRIVQLLNSQVTHWNASHFSEMFHLKWKCIHLWVRLLTGCFYGNVFAESFMFFFFF